MGAGIIQHRIANKSKSSIRMVTPLAIPTINAHTSKSQPPLTKASKIAFLILILTDKAYDYGPYKKCGCHFYEQPI